MVPVSSASQEGNTVSMSDRKLCKEARTYCWAHLSCSNRPWRRVTISWKSGSLSGVMIPLRTMKSMSTVGGTKVRWAPRPA